MGMFIVGAIIFVLYLAGYLFMIKYANDGQRRDMARDDKFEYYQRHNQPNPADYDGMGNYSEILDIGVGESFIARYKKKHKLK